MDSSLRCQCKGLAQVVRRLQQSELQHHRQFVAGDPLFDNPLVLKTENRNRIPAHRFAGNIVTADTGPPQAASDSAVSEPCHQAISGSKNVVYLRFKLRKGFLTSHRHTADAFDSHDGSAGTMHHTVRVKKLINELHLSMVKNLMEISPHQFLFNRQFIGESPIRSHLNSIPAPNLPLDGSYSKRLT